MENKEITARFKGKELPGIISIHRYTGRLLLELFYDSPQELRKDWLIPHKMRANIELAKKIAGTSVLDWSTYIFDKLSYNLESKLITSYKITLLNIKRR